MKPYWIKISLFFLFISALVGSSLRGFEFLMVPFKYQNLVHAHSHVAFQGWVYTILLFLITVVFLTKKQIQKDKYSLQLAITIVIVLGILVSFTLEGYGVYSILFSSIFQLCTYWLFISFLKSINRKPQLRHSISIRFIKTGFLLGFLSSLIPIGLGILSSKGLNNSEAYRSLIYSFLHLQYNGWFLFVLLGITFKLLDNKNVLYNHKQAQIFYWFFSISIIPATCLSFLGMSYREYILIPAVIAAVCQIIGMIYWGSIIKTITPWIIKKNRWMKLFLFTFFFSFTLKVILQFLSVFHVFKYFAFFNKSIVLAYLHLSLIGTISFLIIAILFELKFLKINFVSKIGSCLLIFGFYITQAILVGEGLCLILIPKGLFTGSCLMTLGVLLLIINKQKSTLEK